MSEAFRGNAAVIPASPAPRDTLQDFVYQRVKDLILDGEIEPGRTITMASLASAFSVSHMPVREALHRLTAERAITVVSGRSMGIPQLSLERLEDLCRVRMEVEGLAAAWAAERIDRATLRQLKDLHASLESAVSGSDVRSYLRSNRALHFAVYSAAASRSLNALIESLWLQISPYFNLLHSSGNYAEANRWHGALVAALISGDAEGARHAVRCDIRASAVALKSLLAEHQSGTKSGSVAAQAAP